MKLSNNIVWRRIGDEIFLIDTKKNFLYELNETSALIFEYLADGFDKSDIVNKMYKLYEVDLDVLKNDVDEIISIFIKEGIYEE